MERSSARADRLLGTKAVLVDRLLKHRKILPAPNEDRRQPPGDEEQDNQTELLWRKVQVGRKNKHDHARQTVSKSPNDRVDEPFRLQLYAMCQRQVKQLHRGLIERVTQYLIAAFQENHRGQGSPDQQTARAQEYYEGKHE